MDLAKGRKLKNRKTGKIGIYTGEHKQLFFDTHVWYVKLPNGTTEGWQYFSIL